MKTKSLYLLAFFMMIISSDRALAQGNVNFVTPNNSPIGQSISLHISGTGTQFSQATSTLNNTTSGMTIFADSINVHNDSSMVGFFTIPYNPAYVGLWDVHAGLAAPLVQGFDITANNVIINGTVYHDENSNCALDSAESRLYGRYVLIQPGNIYATINSSGYYAAQLPTGFYTATVTLIESYPGWETVSCPALGSHTINIASTTPYVVPNQDFGTTYTDTCARMKTTIAGGNMRPCFNHVSYIRYENLTPFTASNVVVEAELDNFIVPLSSSPAWSSQAGNTLTYNVGNVGPFEHVTIELHDSISCLAPLGDVLCIEGTTTSLPAACFDSTYNYSEFCRVATSSFDPNDKQTISPQTQDISATDQLTYMIRFQNTGTDTAFKVVVIDTLPASLLPSSLIAGVSSHAYTYEVSGAGIVTFTFNNINLPDSTANEVESHGFVTFSIHQQPGNIPGTQIENMAGIYFDFNPPVITNSTFNEIPLSAGVEEVYSENNGIRVFPNPFADVTRFTFRNKSKTAYSICVYDVTGKMVKRADNINGAYYDMNCDDLSSQVYFYRVMELDRQIGVGKLVILK